MNEEKGYQKIEYHSQHPRQVPRQGVERRKILSYEEFCEELSKR